MLEGYSVEVEFEPALMLRVEAKSDTKAVEVRVEDEFEVEFEEDVNMGDLDPKLECWHATGASVVNAFGGEVTASLGAPTAGSDGAGAPVGLLDTEGMRTVMAC